MLDSIDLRFIFAVDDERKVSKLLAVYITILSLKEPSFVNLKLFENTSKSHHEIELSFGNL